MGFFAKIAVSVFLFLNSIGGLFGVQPSPITSSSTPTVIAGQSAGQESATSTSQIQNVAVSSSTGDITLTSNESNGLQLIAKAKYQGCSDYYTDSKNIYFRYHNHEADHVNPISILNGVDVNTFTVLTKMDGFGEYDCAYSKDINHVYYISQIIPGADPKTFKGLGVTDMAHDNEAVYYRAEKINLVGMNPLVVIRGDSFYITDYRDVYFFSPDARGFDGNSDYTIKKIEGINPKAIHGLGTNLFSIPGDVNLGVGDVARSTDNSVNISFDSFAGVSGQSKQTKITIISGTSTATIDETTSNFSLPNPNGIIYAQVCEFGFDVNYPGGTVRLWITRDKNDFSHASSGYEKDSALCPNSY